MVTAVVALAAIVATASGCGSSRSETTDTSTSTVAGIERLADLGPLLHRAPQLAVDGSDVVAYADATFEFPDGKARIALSRDGGRSFQLVDRVPQLHDLSITIASGKAIAIGNVCERPRDGEGACADPAKTDSSLKAFQVDLHSRGVTVLPSPQLPDHAAGGAVGTIHGAAYFVVDGATASHLLEYSRDGRWTSRPLPQPPPNICVVGDDLVALFDGDQKSSVGGATRIETPQRGDVLWRLRTSADQGQTWTDATEYHTALDQDLGLGPGLSCGPDHAVVLTRQVAAVTPPGNTLLLPSDPAAAKDLIESGSAVAWTSRNTAVVLTSSEKSGGVMTGPAPPPVTEPQLADLKIARLDVSSTAVAVRATGPERSTSELIVPAHGPNVSAEGYVLIVSIDGRHFTLGRVER